MVQRVQIVALGISVALGAALATGLTLGSRQVPVHVGPTAASARDQVDMYAAMIVSMAGAGTAAAPNQVRVSRTIYDTCPPQSPTAPPKNLPCGRTKVSQLKPDIEAALTETLAQRGIQVFFVDDGDFSLHQIVTEPAGTPAADGDVGHKSDMKFHFKRVQGQWQLQGTTVEWMAQ